VRFYWNFHQKETTRRKYKNESTPEKLVIFRDVQGMEIILQSGIISLKFMFKKS
jgi:hypothetical protein